MPPDREPTRIERLIKGSRPSPLELIVGPDRYASEISRNAVGWAGIVVTVGTIGLLITRNAVRGMNFRGVVAIVVVALAMLATMALVGRRGARLFYPWVAIFASGIAAIVVWVSGPGLQATAVIVPAYIAACSLFFTRRNAVITAVITLAGYGAVLGLADGYPRPVGRFLFVAGTTLATALMIARFVDNVERLASSERSLHAEVEAARQQLEARVSEQVDEVERLGRLRRFVTPQIAETLMSRDAESMLATHRKQIAVLMCDLRGFTRFSATAEPEEVVEVLNDYFGVVGKAVEALGATVGGFAGDGVLVYFNDPFPVEDPPGKALSMAAAMRGPMNALGERWARHGFKVGYGIGIAYGYATLSTIGFETRSEYTAIGPVVNLAARLCDQAAPGEVLLDIRAYEAVRDRVDAEPVTLELKGFDGEVTAYRASLDSVVS
ncbi:MAG: hypothetical protein QOF21_3359 [Actinomycetota bacterium]|jgi:class 3 adenylate cyclase